MNRPRPAISNRPPRAWVPWFVLGVALAVTVAAAAGLWSGAAAREQARFENAVQSARDSVRDRLEIYTLLLRGTAGLFASSKAVTKEDFATYVASLDLQERYPGIQGIGWTVPVPPAKVAELEHFMHAHGVTDFRVWPTDEWRDEYTAICYLEPMDERNREAIGFDMASNPTRREAMERARDMGEPAASGVVTLVQEIDADVQPGFLIYVPVYKVPRVPTTVEERRQAFFGWVYSPFRARDLLRGIFGSERAPRVHMTVYDGPRAEGESNLLHRSRGEPIPDPPAHLTGTEQLNVAGRTWTLTFVGRDELYDHAGRKLAWWTLGVGCVLSLMLFGLTRAQATARAAAERAAADLRASEARFRNLFAQSPVTIQICAPDGSYLDVNDAWEELWGTSRDEARGYNVLADPQLVANGVAGEFRRAFDGEPVRVAPFRYDPALNGKVGRARWVEISAYPVKGDAGAVREVVLLVEDVTDRIEGEQALLRSEQRYRSLVSATAQIVWVTNPAGEVVDDLPTWRAFTGQTVEQTMGLGWTDAIHPDDRARVARVWAESVTTGRAHEKEFRVRHHTGEWRDMLSRAVPVLEADGSVREWIGTCADVTDRRRAEAERDASLAAERAARAEAERANRLKDEFLATMSHELRTPLNAILGWAQLIRSPGVDPDEAAHGLETIERNARAQAQLVDDLLDVSRIIAGKLHLDRGPTDLSAVIAAAVKSIRPAVEEKRLRLGAHVEAGVPAVDGDAHRLQQVVWNLLSNAVKFTPAGGRVEVSLRRESGQAVVVVTDTGHGIRPDFLPHVFDRFRQADASTTRKFGGLGLGLGIVRHLVELHGGSVAGASEGEGRGATFTVTLPVIGEASAAAPEVIGAADADGAVGDGGDDNANPGAGPLPPQRLLEGVRVLAVEDDLDSRELLVGVVQTHGGTIRAVCSTREGLDAFAEEPPDVLVSDIGMAGEDGYTLIRRVRDMERATGVGGASGNGNGADTHATRTPALALTAFARAEDHEKAIAAGFDLHVSKPVDNTLLAQTIARLAGRSVPASPATR